MRRVSHALRVFLQTEASGGVFLLAATAIALVWANSPWRDGYEVLWQREMSVGVGPVALSLDLRHWINEGLMTVFFFLVGLEIKRELSIGELRDRRTAALPLVAALGGMILPALIFVTVAGPGEASRGWGIPVATDIAFAIGVLTVLGPRVPSGLKIFLLTLAIIDDIGAILIIALFYSDPPGLQWVSAALACLIAMRLMTRLGFSRAFAYVPLGIAAWFFTFESGIHATIAGVALGLMTPAMPVKGREVLENLERRIHPYSSYLILPLFALANAGVAIGREAVAGAFGSRLTWGVVAGLVVGKTAGITLASAAARKLRIGRMPEGVRTGHLLGAAAVAGIGFTVSLFITGLALESPPLVVEAKIGILAGSLASALLGAGILSLQPRLRP